MGGQACVLYGGAEFSRDTDLAILAEPENLVRLQSALDDLQAERIAVPPFESRYLDMGLAVHFRCRHPEAWNLRVDIMSKMRGVDKFEELWKRRTTFEDDQGGRIELLSIQDLVKAKKTQRDKDWPMLTRLVEANYFENRENPGDCQVEFWMRELRTASLLIEVVRSYSQLSGTMTAKRPLLKIAEAGDEAALQQAIKQEEEREREADREYWAPLREVLAQLRKGRE